MKHREELPHLGSTIVYDNLSEALQESLEDSHIINPKTHNTRRRYFDLPIEEGPLLACLLSFYDLQGGFHVGCVADVRPPNFSFYSGKGSSETLEGRFDLGYGRVISPVVFIDSGGLRNERYVRDITAVSEAFNRRTDCTESLGFCWDGKVDRKDGGYVSMGLSLSFDGDLLTKIHGIDNLDKDYWSFNPSAARRMPLVEASKDTVLCEISEKYNKYKDRLSHHHPQFMYSYVLQELGYDVKDVLIGVLQTAAAMLPPKKPVKENTSQIEKAASDYKLAPKEFDFNKYAGIHFGNESQ